MHPESDGDFEFVRIRERFELGGVELERVNCISFFLCIVKFYESTLSKALSVQYTNLT